MKTSFIESGLSMGAVLTLIRCQGEETAYRARMRWPRESALEGDRRPTITEALESLDEKLLEDCTREALENGDL